MVGMMHYLERGCRVRAGGRVRVLCSFRMELQSSIRSSDSV